MPRREEMTIPGLVQVLPWGEHLTEKGRFVLDADSMAEVIAEFEGRAADMVVDYEHQTLSGGEAPAAGWITRLLNRGERGLWAEVRWTPRAEEYLRNREYRYLSPVFIKRAGDDRVVRLVNVALTNQPAIDAMEAVVNKGALPPDTGKEEEMPEKDEKEEGTSPEDVPGFICEALGLACGAARPEVLGTIAAMRQAYERIGEVSARAEALATKLAERAAQELVELAMKEGKVAPGQRDWAVEYAGRDREGFRTFVAKAPVVVPLGEVVRGGRVEVGGEYAAQAEVNAALGITREIFSKFGKR
jgi:phage I-like protein